MTTRVAEHCSGALIERIKDMACERCVIRLACMTRVVPPEFYWCRRCQGWWLVEEELLVRCDGHTLNDLHSHQAYGPGLKDAKFISGVLKEIRQQHGIEDCPHCTPPPRRSFGRTHRPVRSAVLEFDEAPEVRVIDGYNFAEEP